MIFQSVMKIYELMKKIYDEMEGNKKRLINLKKMQPAGIELGVAKIGALK